MTISLGELELEAITRCADVVTLLRSHKVPEREIAYAVETVYAAGEFGIVMALNGFTDLTKDEMPEALLEILELMTGTLLELTAHHLQEAGTPK